ncbi:MAG: tRNA pseudouridine(55) synthase TruB [Lentisphaeria bacterium]|nr:tRNA pseudouridine(55) synthase TruB [Lentisphaeria bacterium]
MRYDPKKHRLPVCEAAGILLVDKPAMWTSFDVVNFVRSRFNVPKVGHCGTLDPAATGLLVLVLGRFTALSERLSGEDKSYEGTLTLGVETDSGDLDGKVVRRSESLPDAGEVRRVFAAFRGRSMQLPPMYSAVKVGGKKLYELARRGVEVEREAREIEISRLEITALKLPEVDFSMDCSKGTYVRTLCTDIGTELGCGGTLTALRRTRCGRFSLDRAVTLSGLKAMDQEQFTALMAADLVRRLKEVGL